jgi:hypothetical protein
MNNVMKWVPVGHWLTRILAVVLVFAAGVSGQQPATPPSPTSSSPQPSAPPQIKPMAPLPTVQDLKVNALAGNHEMNDLERKIMAPLVVQVLDQNSRPVEGADVVFRFPLNGPGATFADQQTSKKVRTDGRGQATATGWMANGEVGSFDVHVTANYGNQTGQATISMSNVTRIVDEGKKRGAKSGGLWSRTWFKVAVIGGAAAVVAGVVVATRGGKSSSSGSTVTITPGPPTVGAPH